MRAVEDIPDQAIMDAHAIFEILSLKGGISQLLPYLGFQTADDALDPIHVEGISDEEDVYTRIPILDEDAGYYEKLDLADPGKELDQRFISGDARYCQEVLQRFEVRKTRIQIKTNAAGFLHRKLTAALALYILQDYALPQDIGCDQMVELALYGSSRRLGSLGDLGQ